MGKWAQVQCTCVNRTPLPGSDPLFGRPYRKKRRLTKREKAEVEDWKQATENMFACGHRNGVVIELCPWNIVHLGNLLGTIFPDSTFEVFTKVGNWRCYEDELLLVQPEEAYLWLREIEEIRTAFEGAGNLPTNKLEDLVSEYYREDLGARLSLEARLKQVEAEMPFARIVPLKRNVQQTKIPDVESTIETIMEALTSATKLCHASRETGNPTDCFGETLYFLISFRFRVHSSSKSSVRRQQDVQHLAQQLRQIAFGIRWTTSWLRQISRAVEQHPNGFRKLLFGFRSSCLKKYLRSLPFS